MYRTDGQVLRRDLTKPMYACLSALADGRTLGQAVRAAEPAWHGPFADYDRAVFQWFQSWTADGLFVAVDTGRPRTTPEGAPALPS